MFITGPPVLIGCHLLQMHRAAAATLASSGLEELPRTPFAESYLRRILARP